MAIFKINCDKCEKEMPVIENAFRECVERRSESKTELMIVIGITTGLMGFLLGRGIR